MVTSTVYPLKGVLSYTDLKRTKKRNYRRKGCKHQEKTKQKKKKIWLKKCLVFQAGWIKAI